MYNPFGGICMAFVYLNRFSTKGIKNLTANCSLLFDPKGKIKAVYGANGSGKTGLMASVKVLKQCLLDDACLLREQRPLLDLINKKTKKVSLEAIFSVDRSKFSYELNLEVSGADVFLVKERFARFLRGAKQETVFECAEGKLEYLDPSLPIEYKEKTLNLLKRSTLLSNIMKDTKAIEAWPSFGKAGRSMIGLLEFAKNLQVFLIPGDLPSEPYEFRSYSNVSDEMKALIDEALGHNRHREVAFIAKEDLPSYKSDTKRLEKFVALFKPELKKIIVEARPFKGDVISVERIFDYGNGCTVNSYLESTGIRSLMHIFPFVQACASGGIVFIDEMDANINGILLSSLLNYLEEYAYGQLCFTSHDTHLMDSLEKNKWGICFLSPTSGIKHWVKNGHYSAESQWTKGFVPGFAFNYEPLDFFTIFPPFSD